MNCLDFQKFWNDRLDSGLLNDPDIEAELLVHEEGCDSCRQVGTGFRVLGKLLPIKPSHELPSADFVDRVLRELSRKPARQWPLPSKWVPLAAAAALLLSLTAGLYYESGRRAFRANLGARGSSSIGSQRLTVALTEASKATWAFARDTSAPAARVGSDVFSASELREASSRLSFSLPVDVSAEVDSSSEVLRKVGERVNAGVRPLSGTARTAFGFLLGTSLEARPKVSRPGSGA